MSYKKVTVNGQEVGLKFGYASYKIIMTAKNRYLLFDENGNPTDLGVSKIIYSGYQNNCLNKDIDADIPFDDFTKWVDGLIQTEKGNDELKEIITIWSESADIQALVKDSEKKNQVANQPPEISQELSNSATVNLELSPGN